MIAQEVMAGLDAEQLAHLREWEGRSETVADRVTAAPIRGLAATLEAVGVDCRDGAELPEMWHWLYFLPCHAQGELGKDGHAKLGGFLPPVPLPRRMWAGGRLRWHAPLRVGDDVERTSRIESVSHKSGRTGDLVFVLVQHEVRNAHGLALTEEHDIVYRAPPRPGDEAPRPQPAPGDAVWSREIAPDPVLLFRYSALTFNGHRIHYDRSYVKDVEGYPGLVVHGPLIATLLVDLVRREHAGRRLASFSFKAVRPTFDLHRFRVSGRPLAADRGVQLWAQDHEGWLTMQAEARFVD